MLIGERLRAVREAKKLSQRDIEKRTGLIRFYVSRVEKGHAVPSLETIEKFAHGFEMLLYQIFHEDGEPPELSTLPRRKRSGDIAGASRGKRARLLEKFRQLLSWMADDDWQLLLHLAQKMAWR